METSGHAAYTLDGNCRREVGIESLEERLFSVPPLKIKSHYLSNCMHTRIGPASG
jgi:hypothetical protein